MVSGRGVKYLRRSGCLIFSASASCAARGTGAAACRRAELAGRREDEDEDEDEDYYDEEEGPEQMEMM